MWPVEHAEPSKVRVLKASASRASLRGHCWGAVMYAAARARSAASQLRSDAESIACSHTTSGTAALQSPQSFAYSVRTALSKPCWATFDST